MNKLSAFASFKLEEELVNGFYGGAEPDTQSNVVYCGGQDDAEQGCDSGTYFETDYIGKNGSLSTYGNCDPACDDCLYGHC